ncbi:MAG: aspartate--tRNA ligase [Candidatus Saelkia tenebricola]|nr:aspartate--tRNA ligase [Candidatus Saelkia tenebricola]
MLRTHYCGQIRKKDVEKEVSLCGWIYRIREHGKIVFLDLRDREGSIQVVCVPSVLKDNFDVMRNLGKEDVILLKGIVQARPKGTINDKIPTGEVEILINDIEILNKCKNHPFDMEIETEVAEELRLKHRYLDLRSPKLQSNFIFRHKVVKKIRDLFDQSGFIEIETPILTKSTPEGARDFLVPSRLRSGAFYALPQSPQLFKQILMVAGFDKYFQIARCFRDEDLRADRQPEFTQLDLEMSFIEEEDIFTLIEMVLKDVFKYVLNLDIKIPFPRLNHKDVIAKYGSDKPDLRQDLNGEFCFLWIKEFPLFHFNQDSNSWDMEHHPFTAPHADDINLLGKNMDKIRARSYDLVLNGVELGSGSIRIHNRELQKKIFETIGISEEDAERKFGFLLRALECGAPPHGGFALGLDRLITIMLGKESIRDVIAFPKTQRGVCPLADAPSFVDLSQLLELKIKILKEEKNEDKK